MTNQKTINTADAAEVIGYYHIDELHVSDLNPRQDVDEGGIELLAESLITCGLIQNLCGLIEGNGSIGIVGGGRRLRALKIAIEQRPDLAMVPVVTTDDPKIAEEWANAENAAREQLDAVDEIRAYGKMAANGSEIARISKAFGVTETHVRRRLALANLPTEVLDALKEGEISQGIAKAMTISDDKEKVLEVLERATKGYVNEYSIKKWLKPDATSGDSRVAKFVGMDGYQAAGGGVTRNLFEDETLLDNPDILERLFAEKLEDAAEKLKETEGWAWVTTTEEGYLYWHDIQDQFGFARVYKEEGVLTEEQTVRFDALSEKAEADALEDADRDEIDSLEAIMEGEYSADQKRYSGAMIYVNHAGEVAMIEGLVRKEDQAEAIAKGIIEESKHSTRHAPKEKPAYSQKFIDDMTAIRLASVQTALLEKAEYLLDLFGFATSPASGSYNDIFGFGYGAKDQNAPEVVDGFILDGRLGGERSDDEEAARDALQVIARKDMAGAFDDFRETGKKTRNAQITAFLARAFKTQKHDFMSKIETDVDANIRNVWTPTDVNCFKRMKGQQLDDLYKDLLDLDTYTDDLRNFEKLKKSEKNTAMHNLFHSSDYQKAMRVTPDQKQRIDAWFPPCFG